MSVHRPTAVVFAGSDTIGNRTPSDVRPEREIVSLVIQQETANTIRRLPKPFLNRRGHARHIAMLSTNRHIAEVEGRPSNRALSSQVLRVIKSRRQPAVTSGRRRSPAQQIGTFRQDKAGPAYQPTGTGNKCYPIRRPDPQKRGAARHRESDRSTCANPGTCAEVTHFPAAPRNLPHGQRAETRRPCADLVPVGRAHDGHRDSLNLIDRQIDFLTAHRGCLWPLGTAATMSRAMSPL